MIISRCVAVNILAVDCDTAALITTNFKNFLNAQLSQLLLL